MAKERKAKGDRFPVGRFFAWKTRDVSLGCQIIVLGYLSLYASTVLGMPTALVGGLLMASKIIDAFTDLFAGLIVDNTRTKIGRARPYELAILGGWLTTVLLFCCPPAWSMAAKSIWLFSMYALTCSIFQTFLYAAAQPYTVRAWKNRGE
ncbi:MAG: MFS transporter, partial [Firmicutes bacterium]|nr:MFS transporter [Bacillota bacterium]